MKNARILVTGGAGFIGGNLCRRLIAEGARVIALDNLMTGSLDNLSDLLKHPQFRFVEQDIVDPFHFEVDSIFNLACPASPPHYQKNPVHTLITNVQGTHNALRLAQRIGARMLQASTSEVYGDPELSPQCETYRGNVSPIGPRACYDEGKRCAESLIMDYHRSVGTDVRIARIFNTYGPGMAIDDGRVVSNFIAQALRQQPLTIYGDGLQTRSLCYVDDLVDGLIRLMNHPTQLGPVNLGNPTELTVTQIADRIRRLVGSGRIVRCPLPEDDPRRRKPDITLAREQLGFEPKVGVDEGLLRTIRYFAAKLRNDHDWLSATG